MLKTEVKANSISNLTDARYFSAWLIDWLGFDLSVSGLEVLSLLEVKAIKEWVEGPKIIGEVAILDVNEVQQIIDFLELEYIQIGMYTPLEKLNSLKVTSIIKEVIVERSSTFESIKKHLDLYFDYVDYFLFDFNKNKIDWKQLQRNPTFNAQHLQQLCGQYQIFLNINFSPENTQSIVDTIQPIGICLQGGTEEKIGFKSFDELDEIFEKLGEEN